MCSQALQVFYCCTNAVVQALQIFLSLQKRSGLGTASFPLLQKCSGLGTANFSIVAETQQSIGNFADDFIQRDLRISLRDPVLLKTKVKNLIPKKLFRCNAKKLVYVKLKMSFSRSSIGLAYISFFLSCIYLFVYAYKQLFKSFFNLFERTDSCFDYSLICLCIP